MVGGSATRPTWALSDESPCLHHRCVACCLETEMPLTEDDVKRIEKLGFKRIDFTVEVNRETRLKNRNKTCFFLEGNGCKIYEDRPEGCRIYPLIYNGDTYKFIYDPVCPHSDEFKVTRIDKDRLTRLMKKLDRESAKRT